MEETITAWVARDKDGRIYVCTSEPWKLDDQWVTSDNGIDKNKFPQIKWEDKEPTKVELTIKICE
jgi:hypothetical protein